MIDHNYCIVTKGDVKPGMERDRVAVNLARLCKYNPETLRQVFSGRPFVFKSGLDQVTARKYKDVLDKTGIICRIAQKKAAPEKQRPAETSPVETAPVRSVPITSTPVIPAVRITCPKCATEQDEGITCVACQIVMSKYDQVAAVQPRSSPIAPSQAAPSADAAGGFPFLKAVVVLLVVAGLGAGMVMFNPFASAKGELDKASGRYENHHFGFALSFPNNWNAYTVEEAISCSTIRREYADEYLLLISPTNPDHCMMVVNISGIRLESFNAMGWKGMVEKTGQRHPVSYESVDKVNGLTVYRVGYDIAGSYREDAYFEANGTLIQIYFYVRRSFDTVDLATEMRSLLDSRLSSI